MTFAHPGIDAYVALTRSRDGVEAVGMPRWVRVVLRVVLEAAVLPLTLQDWLKGRQQSDLDRWHNVVVLASKDDGT
jgi:hypothetical protein